ncbi:hypothetical protein TanjilG_27497 [Lupinus angustifolius]|uniref:NAC domain-containing protein n=1 Tax=Lupinus angustifolius TaxID=3871 RepID=A0A4P1R393_LUPAN|nr:PREDICTED: NAC domain-containing protein 83-like [Lupinus angustifolius]OIW00246.1 hypothetical protein TanjilG_27497 [Lupinus angustifolius]
MEMLSFVKNGIRRLPLGFRFQPTDEELVFQYLKCKVFSYPLPASIIPEINVCKYDPWDFPGNWEQEEMYFFSSKEAKYRSGKRMNRTTISGYWKATGSDKRILSSTSSCDSIVGIRKNHVFYQGKSPNGSRTDWVMHEYRLVTIQNNYVSEIGDWVLCRLLIKKRSVIESDGSSNHVHKRNTVQGLPRLFDFIIVSKKSRHSYASSSCSSSSDNLEVSSNALDHEETSG